MIEQNQVQDCSERNIGTLLRLAVLERPLADDDGRFRADRPVERVGLAVDEGPSAVHHFQRPAHFTLSLFPSLAVHFSDV